MDNGDVFKAGDICLDCQQRGIAKRLRCFKLNLHGDTLLKCESDECMYPYNDAFSSSDEDEADAHGLIESNGVKFLDDFIEQINNETEIQNANNDLPINKDKTEENCTEMFTSFEISFLDTFDKTENENENMSKNVSEFLDILEFKDDITQCNDQFPSLPILLTSESVKDCEKPSDSEALLLPTLIKNESLHDTDKNQKLKMQTQLTETIKAEHQTTSHYSSNLSPTKTHLSLANSAPYKSTTTDIPKAHIVNNRNLLEKLAIIDKKKPKLNPKFKGGQKNFKNTKNDQLKNDEPRNTDLDYTFERLSEILNSNKLQQKKL